MMTISAGIKKKSAINATRRVTKQTSVAVKVKRATNLETHIARRHQKRRRKVDRPVLGSFFEKDLENSLAQGQRSMWKQRKNRSSWKRDQCHTPRQGRLKLNSRGYKVREQWVVPIVPILKPDGSIQSAD